MPITINGSAVRVHKKVAATTILPTNVRLDEYLSSCSDYKPTVQGEDLIYIVREPMSVLSYLNINYVVRLES